MLAMSDIKCIKLLRNQKGLSISKIAETLHINWRTAKKYAMKNRFQFRLAALNEAWCMKRNHTFLYSQISLTLCLKKQPSNLTNTMNFY